MGYPRTKNSVSEKMKKAISDMRAFETLLLHDDVDPRVLGDFRDALNRVRNVAWAAQQSVAGRLSDKGNGDVGCLLATERLRAAYQLCRALREDLNRDGIEFQKGQLAEMHVVAAALARQLKNRL